jgi:hypothetical protein
MKRDCSGNEGDGQRPNEAPVSQSTPGELTQLAHKAAGVRQADPDSARDGSGIIDLRALMATVQQPTGDASASGTATDRTPIPVIRHFPVYPLGRPEASASAPPPAPPAPPAPRRFKAATALLLALSGAALGALLLRARPAPAPRAVSVPPVGHTAHTAVMREAEPTPKLESTSPRRDAAPSASTASGAPRPPTSATPRATAPARRSPRMRAPATAAKPPPAPPKPSPPPDPCNGDLMCAMKRATERH